MSSIPPTPVSLPSSLHPQNLDTLPLLTALLLRVQTHLLTSPNNPASTPLPASIPASDEVPAIFAITPLSTKEFPSACDELKSRLRRARAAIKELEGIDVGIEEQDHELKMLEEKVERQRAALREIRELGMKATSNATAKTAVGMDESKNDMDIS